MLQDTTRTFLIIREARRRRGSWGVSFTKMNPNNALAITEHEHLFTTNQQVAYPCYVEGRVVC